MCISISRILRYTNPKDGTVAVATFKEYICEELSIYSEGMTKVMKKSFGFVNIPAGVYHDVTNTCMMTEYDNGATAA